VRLDHPARKHIRGLIAAARPSVGRPRRRARPRADRGAASYAGPVTERKIDALTLRWYEARAASPPIVPRWLAAAREHLPAAVPRRFGDSEPLRGRLDRDGEAGLLRAYAQADSLLFLAGARPIYHAGLSAGTGGGPTAVHSLSAGLDPADDAVRRFALALTGPGTVYVSASVAGGLTLDGGTLYGAGPGTDEPYLAAHGDWIGLPPGPPVWCWFGPAYTRLLRRSVDGEPVAGGLLWTGGAWVPEPLRARPAEADPARRTAPRQPRGLRRSVWRLLLSDRRR
jgi:hypothetical protein